MCMSSFIFHGKRLLTSNDIRMIASDRQYGRRVEWLLIANNKLYFFLFNLLFYCFLIERLVKLIVDRSKMT